MIYFADETRPNIKDNQKEPDDVFMTFFSFFIPFLPANVGFWRIIWKCQLLNGRRLQIYNRALEEINGVFTALRRSGGETSASHLEVIRR